MIVLQIGDLKKSLNLINQFTLLKFKVRGMPYLRTNHDEPYLGQWQYHIPSIFLSFPFISFYFLSFSSFSFRFLHTFLLMYVLGATAPRTFFMFFPFSYPVPFMFAHFLAFPFVSFLFPIIFSSLLLIFLSVPSFLLYSPFNLFVFFYFFHFPFLFIFLSFPFIFRHFC